MSLCLCEAVARAQTRRLGSTARRTPVVVGLVAAAWLVAPVLAWRLGTTLAAGVAPLLGDVATARALVAGLCITTAALGATLALTVPSTDTLGGQVASAPIGRSAAMATLALPTAFGAVLTCAPVLVAAVVPLVIAAGGGRMGAFVVLAALAAAGLAGAIAAEGVVRIPSGPATGAGGLCGGAAAALVAVEAGAGAIRGDVSVPAVVGAGVAAVASAVVWPWLAANRPERRPARRRRSLLAPRRRSCAALALAAAALLSRPREARLALLAAGAFAVVGLSTALVTGAPEATGVLLGGGSCAVASCFVPLSVRGRLDPGAWVWRLARRSLVAAAWSSAALALVLAAQAPVWLVAAARPGDASVAAGQILILAALAWASALAAGAVVPRRSRGAGDDALSLGAFAAVAVVLGATVAALGSRLEAAGVPAPVTAAVAQAAGVPALVTTVVALAAAAAGAVAALGVLWGRS